MLSVGISQAAAATARKEEYYADAVRKLQMTYMLGTVVFSTVPGVLADCRGELCAQLLHPHCGGVGRRGAAARRTAEERNFK